MSSKRHEFKVVLEFNKPINIRRARHYLDDALEAGVNSGSLQTGSYSWVTNMGLYVRSHKVLGFWNAVRGLKRMGKL